MHYYPIFLDLRERTCVVVGGGRVAERRIKALLRASACVHVISPAVTRRLAALAAKRKIKVTRRKYRRGDLAAEAPRSIGTPLLIFAATNDPAAQQAIRQEAEALGALLNLADNPRQSAFLVPASFRQGDLQVAISTSAASPALARALRRQLRKTLGREYRSYLRFLRVARRRVLKTIPTQAQRARLLRRLSTGMMALPSARSKSKIKRQKAKIKNEDAGFKQISAF